MSLLHKKGLNALFKMSPDMNNSVSSRQDECHVIHSRLPQAIYLYSSTLLALSNGSSKSFTQQSSSRFTIHTKGVKKRINYLDKRYFCWADKEVKQPKIAPSLSSPKPLSAVTEGLRCAQHAGREKKTWEGSRCTATGKTKFSAEVLKEDQRF